MNATLIYTYYIKLNCESNNEDNLLTVNLEKQNSAFIEVTIQCSGYYDFKTFSIYGSLIKIYDCNKREITSVGSIRVNDRKDMLIYPYLSRGKYYLEVIAIGSDSSINLLYSSRITNSKSISLNTPKDVLSHMHNGKETFSFYSPSGGFYYIKLNAFSQYNTYYLNGAIKIKYNDQIIEKFVLDNYNNEASNIQNANMLVFYANGGKTYNIEISFNDYTIDALSLVINSFEPIEIESNSNYYNAESLIFGDKFYFWNVNISGIYAFTINYIGDCENDIPFCILKENNGSLNVLKTSFFSKYNSNIEFNITVQSGDRIYLGYLNGTSNGSLITSFEKYISQEFEIVTDINENYSLGSEVKLNDGKYKGNIITVGYTRICYLGINAPDRTSRLNYDWNSSNEEIAKVSSYGTITAIRPGRATIIATYKHDKTKVGIIEIDVVPYTGKRDIYLNYGMDVRVGGTISGTEVTSGSGVAIDVSESPYVTMHVDNTRLICLGDDSPSTSIQDFTWISSDTNKATVSAFGTITAKGVGIVVITGEYKYNSYYKVFIEVEVII